jgi:FAD/FMN-containing dehydrogenase
VVRPETTQEVSNILKYCHEERIGVVPQAGNTGLVGGSVSVGNELVLSIERLNRGMKFNAEEGILTCDAGCILLHLTEFCAEHNHLMPLDMGSKGTCLIGGNVSTNAGGQYYYRFGSLHANVLGLEVVLADGRILNLNSDKPNRKDNTGYALHHMFIGSEGTLGIVTKVALACPQLPSSRHAALVACEDWSAVRSTLSEAKKILGETLSAFEFMDEAVLEVMPAKKRMLSGKHAFFLLIECQGSHEQHDAEKMEAFLEVCMDNSHVVDGVLSQDLQQVHDM